MKRKVISVRGVRAAVIELSATSAFPKIRELIAGIEGGFFNAAVAQAQEYANELSKLDASRRRAAQCKKIYMKSRESVVGDTVRTDIVFSVYDASGERSVKKTLWYNAASDVFVKAAKKRIRKTAPDSK